MNLEQATRLIEDCAARMNALYQGMVFDEWAIVSFTGQPGRVLYYRGPRRENFEKNLVGDLKELRVQLIHNTHGVGDFEFARHAVGTRVEAFMVIGQGLYLMCNNTTSSMDAIAQKPRWLSAQVPFVELSDAFRANPLVLSAAA